MSTIAQLVNNLQSLFLADGDRFVATPNFYVFEMYKPHQGATAVRTKIEAPAIAFQTADGRRELFGLAGSASVRGHELTLTLVNPHAGEQVAAGLRIRGGSVRSARRTVLTHADPQAHNTFENPNELVPQSEDMTVSGSSFTVELPRRSITRWDMALG